MSLNVLTIVVNLKHIWIVYLSPTHSHFFITSDKGLNTVSYLSPTHSHFFITSEVWTQWAIYLPHIHTFSSLLRFEHSELFKTKSIKHFTLHAYLSYLITWSFRCDCDGVWLIIKPYTSTSVSCMVIVCTAYILYIYTYILYIYTYILYI